MNAQEMIDSGYIKNKLNDEEMQTLIQYLRTLSLEDFRVIWRKHLGVNTHNIVRVHAAMDDRVLEIAMLAEAEEKQNRWKP